jgi:hypothetical protein
MSPIEKGRPTTLADNQELDDRGTVARDAVEVLRQVRDEAFDSNNEKLALALGRPLEEIDDWLDGAATIDGDVLMKARNLANERGLNIE